MRCPPIKCRLPKKRCSLSTVVREVYDIRHRKSLIALLRHFVGNALRCSSNSASSVFPIPTGHPSRNCLQSNIMVKRLYCENSERRHMRWELVAIALTAAALIGCRTEHPSPGKPGPTTLSTDDVNQKVAQNRAVQAVIWGMPAVNYELMFQAVLSQVHGNFNQIVFWSRPPDWKNQTLTPNPNAIYLMPFINTKDVGPMVLEIPPASTDGSITGNLDDAWQIALEDIGPLGADRGKGGKYLILPPGCKQRVPAEYLPMPSDTYQNYALLRSIPHSGSEADIAKALAYGKRAKLYPLSQAANPSASTFLDASNVIFDSTIPYDLRYYESLNRIVQNEPWLERDKVMIDQLKSIGIEKGKSFSPDAATEAMLKKAAAEAHAWLDARYETLFTPYFDGAHWAVPAAPDAVKGQSDFYADPSSYAVDARAVTYSIGYIGIKHLGGGQFYLMTSKDKDGQPLWGATPTGSPSLR